MKLFKYIIFLLIIIFAISFIVINSAPVSIHYYVGAMSFPLSLLLVASFGIGLIIGFAALLFKMIKLHANLGRTKKSLRAAEQEVDNLRAAFAKDTHR